MWRALAMLLFVTLALVGSRAHAETEKREQAALVLIVNGVEKGESFVLVGGGDVLVPLESIRNVGIVRLDVDTEIHDGVQYVSLEKLSPPLAYHFDERALTVIIIAPPSVLGRTAIDLGLEAPRLMRYDSSPSAFLNYAPRLADGRHFGAYAEAGLSTGATRALTSASCDEFHVPTRLMTQVVVDDRKHLRSATLGDSFSPTGPLGGNVMIGGLTLARNYELNPYMVKIPRLGLTGTTVAPATVDIYVNDNLVRRVPVAPGEFQLTNITPVAGAGSARYVLRDVFGHEQRLETAYYASSTVLAPGLSEYSHAIGFVRGDYGAQSWHYGEPAYVGQHRFGLSRHVTTGFHAETAQTGFNAGTDVTVALGFGEVELHTAGSVTAEAVSRRGVACLVGYEYRHRGTSLRTMFRGTSQEYSNLSLSPDQDRALLESVTTTGHSLGRSANLSTQVVLSLSRNHGQTARLNLICSIRLTSAFGLQISAMRSYAGEGVWENNVYSALNWSLPGHHSAALGAQAGAGGQNATARIAKPLIEQTDVGYRASGTVGESSSGSATVEGRSSVGQVGATYTNVNGDGHTLLEASGSVVYVGRKVSFSRPATQSFAVIDVPGAAGVRGYLNNSEVGRTDSKGRLFIQGLQPYQGNRLRIEQADLPMDYRLDEPEIVLAPPTRGGAVVRFDARPVRLVRGRIVSDLAGKSPLSYGSLSVEANGVRYDSPLGSDGQFELDGLPPGTWGGVVQAERGSCRVLVRVESADELVLDVGTLTCKPGSGVAR